MGIARRIPIDGVSIDDVKSNESLELTDAEQSINQRVANLRKAKKLTQKEFAEKLNVSDKLVSKWEQEGSNLALEDAVNICKQFNLTFDYLIDGKKSTSDVKALKPLPPPLPAFVDPIQTLVKKIETLINKNKLQQYKEQLFPSSSENLLYDIAERVRKATLEDWSHIKWEEESELKTGGYQCYIYRGTYVEDRRSPKKPIDEKYWGQVQDRETYFGQGNHIHISKQDKHLLEQSFGIFIIEDFGQSALKKVSNNNEYRLVEYDISFSINLNALLALDNFEIYIKLAFSGIPLRMNIIAPSQVKKSSGYFNLKFEELKYYEIFEKLELKPLLSNTIRGYLNCLQGKDYQRRINTPKSLKEYAPTVEDGYILRDLNKAPITYTELLGLTDLRFFGLLKKEELDQLLEAVNIKHKRIWEIIAALIENGAVKKKLVKVAYDSVIEEDDALATLMLYEIAKVRTNK